MALAEVSDGALGCQVVLAIAQYRHETGVDRVACVIDQELDEAGDTDKAAGRRTYPCHRTGKRVKCFRPRQLRPMARLARW